MSKREDCFNRMISTFILNNRVDEVTLSKKKYTIGKGFESDGELSFGQAEFEIYDIVEKSC